MAFELVEEYLEASKFRFPQIYNQSSLFEPIAERSDHQPDWAIDEEPEKIKWEIGVSQPLLIEPRADYRFEDDAEPDPSP